MPRPDLIVSIDVAIEDQDGLRVLEGPWTGESPVMRLECWTVYGEIRWARDEFESDDVRLVQALRPNWSGRLLPADWNELAAGVTERLKDWIHNEALERREAA